MARAYKYLNVDKSERLKFVSDGAHGTTHFLKSGDKLAAIVCMNRDITRNDAISLLVHEATHVWQAIQEDISDESPGDEIEAYSIQCIFRSLLEEYEKQK